MKKRTKFSPSQEQKQLTTAEKREVRRRRARRRAILRAVIVVAVIAVVVLVWHNWDHLAPDRLMGNIENLFGMGQNVTTGIGVAQARGVILLAIRQAGVQISSYKPAQVKQSVVGYGNATKHQVMDMTKRLLGLQQMPKPDDAADAIALALCHGRSSTSLLSQISK